MKKIIIMIAITIPFMSCAGPDEKPEKDGWYSDAGKHFAEPASEKLKQAIDQNAPILSEGMKGLGKEFGQVFMQQLPQNILLSGAIVMGTVVVSKITDAGIRHVEKSISGELAYEQIENKRKDLESYRSFVNSHSTIADDNKKWLIIIKEHKTAMDDFLGCYRNTVSTWIPFTRSKLYCTEDGFPIECHEEYFRLKSIFPSEYSERFQKEFQSGLYEKK